MENGRRKGGRGPDSILFSSGRIGERRRERREKGKRNSCVSGENLGNQDPSVVIVIVPSALRLVLNPWDLFYQG